MSDPSPIDDGMRNLRPSRLLPSEARLSLARGLLMD